jgi:hypothetical protein
MALKVSAPDGVKVGVRDSMHPHAGQPLSLRPSDAPETFVVLLIAGLYRFRREECSRLAFRQEEKGASQG